MIDIAFDDVDRARGLALAHGLYTDDPGIVADAAADLEAFVARDPSCAGELDAFLNYKGFRGWQCHRAAHSLWTAGRRSLARYVQGRVAQSLAMDLHPGAVLGRALFIDHGTAIVIGKTAGVESNVSMLHAVTLCGTGKAAGDRHPKIREGVMIGAGAKILGNVEIGSYSKIAAGSRRAPIDVWTDHAPVLRSRKALATTETELKLIAAAAMTGLRSIPNAGYRTPAAIGTPTLL